MKKCFICLDENIILSCRTCRHGLGGNCFQMLKKCPFCRADFKKEEKEEIEVRDWRQDLWLCIPRFQWYDEMVREEQERIRVAEETRRMRIERRE